MSEQLNYLYKSFDQLWTEGIRPGNENLDFLINQINGVSEAALKMQVIEDIVNNIQSAFSDVSSIEDFANAIREAALDAIAAIVAQAVTSQIAKAMENSKNPWLGLILGAAMGGLTKALFSKAIPKLAGGGEVPQGYPNDTFPAWLTSGEKIIPAGKSEGTKVYGELHMTPKKLWWAIKEYEKTLQHT
jgi:hypothetical protein